MNTHDITQVRVTNAFYRLLAVISFALATAFLSGPAAADEAGAIGVVEAFHADLIEVMKAADTTSYEERREALAPDIAKLFDSRFMAGVAASSYWRGLDDAQKSELADAFRSLTLANYAARFNGYSGQEFETVGTQPAGSNRLFVKTILKKASGDSVKINYLLVQKGDDWKIVDIVVKSGISELALRRSEFSPILRDQGFAALIAMINTKVEDLADGKES